MRSTTTVEVVRIIRAHTTQHLRTFVRSEKILMVRIYILLLYYYYYYYNYNYNYYYYHCCLYEEHEWGGRCTWKGCAGVRQRVSLPGLPNEHTGSRCSSLVVVASTYIEDSSFIPFGTMEDRNGARCLTLNPSLVSRRKLVRFPSNTTTIPIPTPPWLPAFQGH